MKILTVSIAAYNVEKFIEQTLKSILVNNIDDLEVLVEDDGGTDGTAEIVKKYEEKYQGIVKFVHKENGGYGSTINKSIKLAQGKYFKQLDGDDWYDSENFEKFLNILRKTDVDVVYSPYKRFYEKFNKYETKDYFENSISGEYEVEEIINKSVQHLSMYTVTYKTQILKDNNINLKTKCLYTDKEYAMYPMVYSNKIYISHLPIYVYRIGREEQSMSISSKRKHYQEHIDVTYRALEIIYKKLNEIEKNKRNYLIKYLGYDCAATVSDFLIILPTNKENLNKIKDFEKKISNQYKEVYDIMIKRSKILNILKKSNYNYLVYKILNKKRISKLEKNQ